MYTLDMMPGPTPQACELQLKQYSVLERLYDAYNETDASMSHQERNAAPVVVAVLAEYNDTVLELTNLLGPNVPCSHVDAEQWSFFSDAFKADVGCRPSGFWSREQVHAWIARKTTDAETLDIA